MVDWLSKLPEGTLLNVSSVGFKGKTRNWRGGGVEDRHGPFEREVTPYVAVKFLLDSRDRLWRFPRVGPGEPAATIGEAALQVRKPDVSLVLPFDNEALANCGDNPEALQDFLQRALPA
jgi:hypothetical protein